MLSSYTIAIEQQHPNTPIFNPGEPSKSQHIVPGACSRSDQSMHKHPTFSLEQVSSITFCFGQDLDSKIAIFECGKIVCKREIALDKQIHWFGHSADSSLYGHYLIPKTYRKPFSAVLLEDFVEGVEGSFIHPVLQGC